MCILCYGLTGEEHWTDARVGAEAPASIRARREALLGRVLGAAGVDYRGDPTGVTAWMSDRKGATQVTRSLGEVWAAGEQLAKRPLDPLDPVLIARLQTSGG